LREVPQKIGQEFRVHFVLPPERRLGKWLHSALAYKTLWSKASEIQGFFSSRKGYLFLEKI
jgi:hypothetical protein